jgi:hypothetical protein
MNCGKRRRRSVAMSETGLKRQSVAVALLLSEDFDPLLERFSAFFDVDLAVFYLNTDYFI